jgi:hypothetical protein
MEVLAHQGEPELTLAHDKALHSRAAIDGVGAAETPSCFECIENRTGLRGRRRAATRCLWPAGMYVVMDGFDLGIGIFFPLVPGKDDRDVMMNTVAPVWDGNETWLVLGGAGSLAAFPLAYAVILAKLR